MTTLEEQASFLPDMHYSASRRFGDSAVISVFSNSGYQDWGSAIGGVRYGFYQSSDISDILQDGAVLDAKTGAGYASSTTALVGAQKLSASYDAFCRTYAGSRMIQQIGKPQWDAFVVGDFGPNALAATISRKDGARALAWNKEYDGLIDAGLIAGPNLEQAILDNLARYGSAFNPNGADVVARAAAFYEAMRHEAGHYSHFNNIFARPVEVEEYKTYMETADFYRQLAEETKDSNYAMSKFYEAIADSSQKKASVYGRDSDDYRCGADSEDYGGLEDAVGFACDSDCDPQGSSGSSSDSSCDGGCSGGSGASSSADGGSD